MKEKIAKLLENKKTAKIIFIAGIIGIILIFISSFTSKDEEIEMPKRSEFSEAEYCSVLEEDIRQIVSGICGDGASVVTVTLDTGIVYEYASELKEKGAEDESKTSEESEKTYITVRDEGGAETPLIITSYMPKIRGVSVICNADEVEAEEIKNAVCAALDITSRKIYIGRKTVQ